MRALINVLYLVLIFSLAGCGQLIQPSLKHDLVEIKPGNYSLDKQHTSILFKVNHMGLSTFVGRFNEFDASLEYNADDITQSRLQAVIEMRSVDVNNEKFERALTGKFWFNTEAYPQASFTTQSAERISDTQVKFTGLLTFLGEQKPIDLMVTFNGAGNNMLTRKYTLGFSAHTTFNRSEFGLDQYIPAVGDAISIEVHAEFQRN
ncbi:Protein YceI [Thalassocella blandensis]|nr:Protein YceI [Thalassocella blandensis]